MSLWRARWRRARGRRRRTSPGGTTCGSGAAEAARLVGEFRALVSIPNAGGRYSTRILPEPEKLASLRLRAGELLSAR